MRQFLLLVVSFLVLTACESNFDITRYAGNSTVWMSFLPSNDYDTTFFILQATTPLAGTPEPVITSGETVEVQVNGQPLVLEKNYRSLEDRIQYYSTKYEFEPGDKVETVASVPGAGTVSASCVVPELFPNYTWSAKIIPGNGEAKTLIVEIDYADSGHGGYFGSVVSQYIEEESQREEIDSETGEKHWGDIMHSSHIEYLSPCAMTEIEGLSFDSDDPVTVTPMYFNTLSNNTGDYRRVQIWSDAFSPSKAKERRKMTFASRCYEHPAVREYHGDNGQLVAWAKTKYKYRLTLYHFSESCYNYLKAQYNKSHDEFSGLGLAPASFVYTNVRGGAGVCGAYLVESSEWVELGN